MVIMTIEEVAEYLKISKETVYKMVHRNEIPGSKIGNQWRFKKDKIDQWLDNLSNVKKENNIDAKVGDL